jgi:hypothetical protein
LFSSSFSRKKATENPEKALSTGFEPRQRLLRLFSMSPGKDKGFRINTEIAADHSNLTPQILRKSPT